MLDTYFIVQNMSGLIEAFTRLVKIYFQQNNNESATQLLHRCEVTVDDVTEFMLQVRFIRSLLLYGQNVENISTFIENALDLCLDLIKTDKVHEKELQRFLFDIKSFSAMFA